MKREIPNKRRIDGATTFILLNHGKAAAIDTADWNLVKGFHWFARTPKNNPGYWYCCANMKRYGKRTCVDLHRFILGHPDWKVDHRDRDGLNNRRFNLRQASSAQNQANSRKQAQTSSRFKGVYWSGQLRKWVAQITYTNEHGRRVHKGLGCFTDETMAGKAYASSAISIFGEFAHSNL